MYSLTERFRHVNGLMPRKRLFPFFLTLPHKKLITLLAGAGYGKTSLLISFFQSHPTLGSWVTLSHPLYSFKDLTDMLALRTNEEPFWIVIDQTENLQFDKQEVTHLNNWIETLPPTVTLVLSGRKIPEGLLISRWKVNGLAVSIDKSQLAFTEEEATELFHSYYGMKMAESEISYLMKHLEGWAAGLVLFREAATFESGVKKQLEALYSSEEFFQYVAAEVVEGLSAAQHTFLLYISLFRELNEELLQEFLPDLPVRTYIKTIESRQLIFAKNGTDSVQMHKLFRLFFYKQAEREWGQPKVKALHREIALLCRKHFRFFEALSQAFAAGDDECVIEMITELADRYEPKEYMRLLDGWLEQLSPSLHLSGMSLLLFRCLPVELAGQLVETLELMAHRCQSEEASAYADLCHRLATIFFYKGELRRAAELYETSLDHSHKNGDRSLTALNLSLLAQAYRFMDKADQALTFSRQALVQAEVHGFKHIQMHALWNIAELLLDNGELEKARKFAEQAIHISRGYDEAAVIYPICSLSRYFRLKGRLKEALQWGTEAVKCASRFGILADRGWASRNLSQYYQAAGNLAEARKLSEEAFHLFKNFRHLSCIVQQDLIVILRNQGNTEEADQLQKAIDRVIMSSGYEWMQVKEVEKKKPQLHLQMLGPLAIRLNGKELKIKRTSSLKLLIFLALNSERRWSKNELIGVLFPEENEEAATNQFYVALSVLRKILEPELANGRHSRYISYDGSHYYFQADETVSDVEILKRFFDCPYTPEALSQSVKLYRGDLLSEYPYEEWIMERQIIIREQYVKTLDQWAAACKREGKIKEAADILELMIKLEPLEESYHVEYIRLLIQKGKAGKSRKAAERAVLIMEKELGVNLRPQFNKLFTMLKS